MNTIILCEGKTDAVLLGYYIDKVCGFTHTKEKINKTITIGQNKENEFFTWHIKGNDCLAIWGIGGKDCFMSAIESFFNVLKKSSDDLTYQKFAIVCDRDMQKDDSIILSEFSQYFSDARMPFENNKIQNGVYFNSFGQAKSIITFTLIIPQDKFGALETVLLESIKEDEYDKKIVEKSDEFVTKIRAIANKYIQSDRLELKAKLSTVFAIMSPEKVFSFIDEILKTTVKWEEKQYVNELFKELIKLTNEGNV